MKRLIINTLVVLLVTTSLTAQDIFHEDSSFTPQAFKTAADGNIFRIAGGASAGIQVNGFVALTGDKDPVVPIGFQFRFAYAKSKNMYSLLLGPEFIHQMFLPVNLEYRYILKLEDKTPYLYGKLGYSWHLAGTYENRYQFVPYTDYDAGVTFGAGAGYSVISGQSEFHFSIGYKFQNLVKSNFITVTERDVFEIDIHSIELKVGIIFH